MLLGLPSKARVALFVGDDINNKRKGFEPLVQALQSLEKLQKIALVSVGRGMASTHVAGTKVLNLGHVSNDIFLAATFSAADVFVIPSLQEAFGQTALEAMACGTPVVGFDVGGIPDMVRPGITGLLVPPGDVAALGAAITKLLDDDPLRREMCDNCRRVAVEEYDLEVQARRYAQLYERLLARD